MELLKSQDKVERKHNSLHGTAQLSQGTYLIIKIIVTEAQMKRKLDVEYLLLKEKQKFNPLEQEFDLQYLNNFTKNVDNMKKRVRQLKSELALWTDKQM